MAIHKCRSESTAGHQEITSNAKKSNKQKHNPTVQQKSSGKCACNTITQFVGEMYLPHLAVRKKREKNNNNKKPLKRNTICIALSKSKKTHHHNILSQSMLVFRKKKKTALSFRLPFKLYTHAQAVCNFLTLIFVLVSITSGARLPVCDCSLIHRSFITSML